MTVETLRANQPAAPAGSPGSVRCRRCRTARWTGWARRPATSGRPRPLSTLADGRLPAEAVAADPRWWLGPDRTDTGVLVKLLDAGQRLPLHVHPDRRFATAHLASPYGKTEAWVIVSARPDAYVHQGFARDVPADELAGLGRRAANRGDARRHRSHPGGRR